MSRYNDDKIIKCLTDVNLIRKTNIPDNSLMYSQAAFSAKVLHFP